MTPFGRRRPRPGVLRVAAALAAVAVTASIAIPAPAGASTTGDLKAANHNLSDLIVRIQGASAQLDSLRNQISALLAEVDANRRVLEQTEAAIRSSQEQAGGIQARIRSEQAAIDGRAVQAYEAGPASMLAAILDASSVGDLQGRLETLAVVAQSDQALIGGLRSSRAALTAQRSDLTTLQGRIGQVQRRLDQMVGVLRTAMTQQQDVVVQLQADESAARVLVARLKAKREREQAARALAEAGGGGYRPPAGPPPPGTDAIRGLIVWYFTPLGRANVDLALCVGYRESRYQPNAVNSSSGAAGVFQFMPFLWPIVSKAAGWAGASVFNARANVAVAAWTVANYGWSPWNSDSGFCPI